jgi:hypothetical protein
VELPEAAVMRRAASLLLHMSRWDLPAFLGCLAEVRGEDEAKDIIIAVALLARMDTDVSFLQEITVAEALREVL